jgi:hypothetical protein
VRELVIELESDLELNDFLQRHADDLGVVVHERLLGDDRAEVACGGG